MQSMVDARNHRNAIGRYGQLRGRFRVGRCPALQRQQADGHLQVVHQPMIRFPAQQFLLLDQLVLSAKARLTFRQRIAQTCLQRSMLEPLLAALDNATRRTGKRQPGRQTPAGLVGFANLLRNCCLTAHTSNCASLSCTKLIQVKYKSEFVHKRRFSCFAHRRRYSTALHRVRSHSYRSASIGSRLAAFRAG
jgi:hypothetical protein